MNPRTGVKNDHNVCWLKPLPGPLADAAGVRVSEYDLIGLDSNSIRTKQGRSYACSQWCDVLSPEGAEPIAW
ncbi:beta-galactosidase trimerization domain-containing protein [Paenibacillus sp. N4]|nr:beta-galactosidase trimerization domain-containing protein [Paenibacillus vietnamensis]